MRVANPGAGEVEIVLDGEAWVLRPGWKAVVAIEKLTGQTMLQLAQRMNDGRGLPLEDAATIVVQGIHCWATVNKDDLASSVRVPRVLELLYAGGVKCWLAPVLQFLVACVDPERAGNADPTAGETAS